MTQHIRTVDNRRISIIGFSLIFGYLLSFVFEGQVLYSFLASHNISYLSYILIAIAAHFVGLLSCGFFINSGVVIKRTMLISTGLCLIATVPFLFPPSFLWSIGLIISGYTGGLIVAAWGYFFKTFTSKNDRIKFCADVIILSNVIMIAINIVAINFSAVTGLILSVICLGAGMTLIWLLPVEQGGTWGETEKGSILRDIKQPLLLLYLFVFIITINSGLMYQVINPSFNHLKGLVSWYWAVPYITAIFIMRSLTTKSNRSIALYIGMAMIVGAFIGFMILGRNVSDYLVINTLMLGACGIFDLFWWSILGEMLDYAKNPVKVFGIGLSSNVLGVLSGDALGIMITSSRLPEAEVAVIAITVVCITLIILPPLNRRLVMLLKSHVYLTVYDGLSKNERTDVLRYARALEELTVREKEVLEHILLGKTNREIGNSLHISESTVKTHIRNIFSKYDVVSRAELISTLLKNQTNA